MPSYSGVWTLTAQYQALGAFNWPGAPLQGNIGLFAVLNFGYNKRILHSSPYF
jgi:hypothetical protein